MEAEPALMRVFGVSLDAKHLPASIPLHRDRPDGPSPGRRWCPPDRIGRNSGFVCFDADAPRAPGAR